MEVRAAERSLANAMGPKGSPEGSGVGDAPIPPDLLDPVPEGEPLASATAGGACDARKRHGAGAGAVVSPGRTAKPWKKDRSGAEAFGRQTPHTTAPFAWRSYGTSCGMT